MNNPLAVWQRRSILSAPGHSDERLSTILEQPYIGQTRTEALDSVYTTILQHPLKILAAEETDSFFTQFHLIVGSIVVLFETLPAITLGSLLDITTQEITARLSDLHSVLDVPNDPHSPIKLLHLSFRDFLLDPVRCADQRLTVPQQMAHQELFACCLRIMQIQLKRDLGPVKSRGMKDVAA